MLSDSTFTTMVPVSDVDRATRFYGTTLGLRTREATPDGSPVFEAGGGATIGLLPAGEGAQGAHTVLSFEVGDIAAEIRELSGRGVAFADYDQPGLRTVGHVADLGGEKAAWFADSEGNVLCLHQTTG